MKQARKANLFWEGVPQTVSEFVDLRKCIKDFKAANVVEVLKRYYDSVGFVYAGQSTRYPRFCAYISEAKDGDGKDAGSDTGESTSRVGLFSTAACLGTLARYSKDGSAEWLSDLQENNEKYFEFIIRALAGRFKRTAKGEGVQPGFLSKITTLNCFGKYLRVVDEDGRFLGGFAKSHPRLWTSLREVCAQCIDDFTRQLQDMQESIHPFVLYEFIIFFDLWGEHIREGYSSKRVGEGCSEMTFAELSDHVSEKVYFLAKYELYRQMALKLSGDMSLYDAKRLIYSLLVVYWKDKFSNNLVGRRALNLIFEPHTTDPNSLWPTGQLLPLCRDNMMSVSSIQCIDDLLSCENLWHSLKPYQAELKAIYDFYSRTLRVDDGEVLGWYPHDQRDKTTQSWTTAFVLDFVKRYCTFLSFTIREQARTAFQGSYRKPDTEWSDIYDGSAAKSKLRLLFDDGNPKDATVKRWTALLFGPPGTGKTTYARALATRLDWEFLELTPGDFFSGGEDSILSTINKVFENLLHLERTVVFIDEIDDLVRNRETKKEGSPYDPRDFYVDTLLPRFQELHDRKNIVLIMATNHLERVDVAISRLGRIDLIVPIGAMSIHGRLRLFFEDRVCSELSTHKDIAKLLDQYLYHTADMSFQELQLYFERLSIKTGPWKTRFEAAGEELAHRDSALKDFREKFRGGRFVVKDDNNERQLSTRPTCTEKDFQDIGDPEGRQNVIRLFLLLRSEPDLDASGAAEIAGLVHDFCVAGEFGAITPFYDDLEALLSRTEGLARGPLDAAFREIGSLMADRRIV